MRIFFAISTSILALAILAPAYAQQDQHEQKEEEKSKPTQENEKKEQPAKPAKQDERNAQQHAQPEPAKQDEKNAQQQHAQPEQHGGGRIPDDRYKANFGRDHRFRVSQGDYSNRRFQYGGYSFGFVGAWPSNWLYTQDVFVVEINGVYYLCNATYPGVNLELSVTL
jgi:hypothetical protein